MIMIIIIVIVVIKVIRRVVEGIGIVELVCSLLRGRHPNGVLCHTNTQASLAVLKESHKSNTNINKSSTL